MGTLYIVTTPIGNLEDITIRAIKTLFSADIIACEDTRRTGLLLQELQKRFPWSFVDAVALTKRLFSYYDAREHQRTPEIVDLLRKGNNVALVSDAGTPLVSDPGFRLVREAVKQGINVISIPGPSAAIAALTVSGFPTDKFFFLGYPPEKSSHRIKLFDSLLREISRQARNDNLYCTHILYCSPHKLQQTLEDMKTVFGNIDIVIARELTKIHEEIWRGNIFEALRKFTNPVGEFVLLFTLREEL